MKLSAILAALFAFDAQAFVPAAPKAAAPLVAVRGNPFEDAIAGIQDAFNNILKGDETSPTVAIPDVDVEDVDVDAEDVEAGIEAAPEIEADE